jgi:hypothetical protein
VISAEARETLAFLECATGHPFDAMPVHRADQWSASLRDAFAMEGVDVGDPVQAQAAFAGVLAVAEVFLVGDGAFTARGARHVALSMRALADRAEA